MLSIAEPLQALATKSATLPLHPKVWDCRVYSRRPSEMWVFDVAFETREEAKAWCLQRVYELCPRAFAFKDDLDRPSVVVMSNPSDALDFVRRADGLLAKLKARDWKPLGMTQSEFFGHMAEQRARRTWWIALGDHVAGWRVRLRRALGARHRRVA